MDHRKQVARPGITCWTEHTHETLARLLKNRGKLLNSNHRVDVVTQYRLAGIDITGEQAFAFFL
jgi:hypothetical protein